MRHNILSEINRNRELMGLSLLLETTFPFSLSDEIYSLLGITKKINLVNWSNSVSSLSKKIEVETLDTFDSLAAKFGISKDDLLRQIQQETLPINQFDEVVVTLMKQNDVFFNKLYYKFLEKNPELKSLVDSVDSISKDNNLLGKVTKDDIDDFKQKIIDKANNDPNIGTELRKLITDKLSTKLSEISKKLPSKLELAKEKLKQNTGNFKKEFMSMFDRVVEKYGKKWDEILPDSTVYNTLEGIEIIKKSFPGKKFKTRNGNEVTIDEFEQMIQGYKGFQDKNGNWSKLNFLDTNFSENTDLFLTKAKENLPEEEYEKLLNGLVRNEKPKDQIVQIIGIIEKDENLWKKLMENPDILTKIYKTTEVGQDTEQLANKWISSLEGFESNWVAREGDPIDRLLGIDLIFKDSEKVTSTANVKSFTGTISPKINKNDIWGESYKVWSKYSVYIAKPENLDYAIFVDSGGNMILFKKQPVIDWVQQKRMDTVKFVTLKNGRYGYIDKTNNVRVYWVEK